MIEDAIQEEDTNSLNSHTVHNITTKYIMQKWTEVEGKLDKLTIIIKDSINFRLRKQIITKSIDDLNNKLTSLYRILKHTVREHIPLKRK